MKYKCLSIAGFDGSGGAGIQADLKTFSALGCYGMTVLTALPVQNTCGVKSCYSIPLAAIKEQLETIFEDITPDAIKIGMLFETPIIEIVADFLKVHARNIPIILDPVMIAKSGDPLLMPDAMDALKKLMIPISTLITPNIPEAYALCASDSDSDILTKKLLDLGCNAVLLKGGHQNGITSDDLFIDSSGFKKTISSVRIISKNTHGTGCTLSAAITSFIAKKIPLLDSVKLAKEYLLGAIAAASQNSVGKGHGPVHHFYNVWSANN
ncbi:MAG: bifunctional hydroxymethylpyrimidine kinase/phosphomethylpyrimidine kinase [Gammaproteobacteria bacterium]